MDDILDKIYSKALGGVAGFDSAEDLAREYLSGSGSLNSKADSLIRWQVAKCATSGFITGLGGAITLPVSVPADLSVNLLVQMRMSAAIAYMGGHDIYSDKVRSFIYATLCGNAVGDVLKEAGVQAATKFTVAVIQKKITGEMVKNINKAVMFRLVTKAGSKGVINLVKIIPVFGGVVNAAFNVSATNTVGEAAKRVFLADK